MGGYRHHPAFERPPESARLWRYIDFAKLVDLVDRSTLFFSRADHMLDPWEGSMSQPTIEAAQANIRRHVPDTPEVIRNLELARRDERLYRERIRMFVLLSCWYLDDHESAAMWELYASREGSGVAIQSTFGRLEEALPTEFEHFIYAGKVGYVDYATEVLPYGNTFFPFLHKRRSFAHEREVRAIIDVSSGENMHPSILAPPTIEHGLDIPVDVEVLVERVHLAPTAPDWIVALVKRTAERYGLSAPVVRSDLAAGPIY